MKTNANKDDLKDTKPLADIADAARKNYEQAIRTNLKLQEEANRWWTSMLNQSPLAQDWQKRFNTLTGVANSFVPVAQKNVEEVIDLVEKNTRTSAELIKKAVDAVQTPALSESQAKWVDFWTCSMGAVRSNTEAVSQLGTKAIDSWIAFIQKTTEVADLQAAK